MFLYLSLFSEECERRKPGWWWFSGDYVNVRFGKADAASGRMGPMGPNRFGDPWFPSHLGRRKPPTTAVRPTIKWEFGEFTIQRLARTGGEMTVHQKQQMMLYLQPSQTLRTMKNIGVVLNIMEFWWLPPRIWWALQFAQHFFWGLALV